MALDEIAEQTTKISDRKVSTLRVIEVFITVFKVIQEFKLLDLKNMFITYTHQTMVMI